MRVVIGGAGVAALEAAAALRRLAAGRVSVTLVAPYRTFRTRALQPFAAFGIDSPRGVAVHALADRLEAQLIEDRVAWVDRDRYTVHCRSGRPIAFEALVLGVGATLHVRYPRALALHGGRRRSDPACLRHHLGRRPTRCLRHPRADGMATTPL